MRQIHVLLFCATISVAALPCRGQTGLGESNFDAELNAWIDRAAEHGRQIADPALRSKTDVWIFNARATIEQNGPEIEAEILRAVEAQSGDKPNARLLGSAVEKLCDAGRFEAALAMAKRQQTAARQDPTYADSAAWRGYRRVVESQARRGLFSHAEKTARAISAPEIRSAALQVVAWHLCKENPGRTLALVRETPNMKAEGLATELFRAGHDEVASQCAKLALDRANQIPRPKRVSRLAAILMAVRQHDLSDSLQDEFAAALRRISQPITNGERAQLASAWCHLKKPDAAWELYTAQQDAASPASESVRRVIGRAFARQGNRKMALELAATLNDRLGARSSILRLVVIQLSEDGKLDQAFQEAQAIPNQFHRPMGELAATSVRHGRAELAIAAADLARITNFEEREPHEPVLTLLGLISECDKHQKPDVKHALNAAARVRFAKLPANKQWQVLLQASQYSVLRRADLIQLVGPGCSELCQMQLLLWRAVEAHQSKSDDERDDLLRRAREILGRARLTEEEKQYVMAAVILGHKEAGQMQQASSLLRDLWAAAEESIRNAKETSIMVRLSAFNACAVIHLHAEMEREAVAQIAKLQDPFNRSCACYAIWRIKSQMQMLKEQQR